VFIAGTAFAYWTTTGAGTGAASTTTDTPMTVAQNGAITGLAPDTTAQPIAFTITNPAAFPQKISGVTVSIGTIEKTSDGTPATGCTAGDFALVQPTALNTKLSAGPHAYPSSGATIQMVDGAGNQDACKLVKVNLVFTIPTTT